MVRYQNCSSCGEYDITGTMGCAKDQELSQLCPRCASKVFGVPEEMVRASLTLKLSFIQRLDEWREQAVKETNDKQS